MTRVSFERVAGGWPSLTPPPVTARLNKLSYGLDRDHVEPALITQKVAAGIYPGITTAELDTLAAETAASMTTMHS